MDSIRMSAEDLKRVRSMISAGVMVLEQVLRGERKYDDTARMAIPSVQTGINIINSERELDKTEVKREEIAANLLLKAGNAGQIKDYIAFMRQRALLAGGNAGEGSRDSA